LWLREYRALNPYTPNAGTGENDRFAAATAADGSTWAVGWDINTSTGNHDPLIL
jgi:hypothetical protein